MKCECTDLIASWTYQYIVCDRSKNPRAESTIVAIS